MLWQPFSQNTTEVHKFYCMCAMDTMYIPYFVSRLHPHPLRYWSVLLLFPTKLAFNDKRLVSSLQHTTQCWRQQNIKIHCAPEKLHTVLMIFTPHLIKERSILPTVFVCPWSYIHNCTPNLYQFLCTLPMVTAWSFSGIEVIWYIFLVYEWCHICT